MPFEFAGDVLGQLGPMFAASVRMAIQGTSAQPGSRPAWLRRAGDVRLVDISEGPGHTTILHAEAPNLGEAAEEIYRQQEFWETRPSPEETAINILGRITGEIRSENRDSTLYDLALLNRFSRTDRLFRHKLQSLDLPVLHGTSPIDRDIAIRAATLSRNTPSPRQVRVAGKLDMVRHSTRSFELLLADDTRVRGVVEDSVRLDVLKSLLGDTVTVVGRAVYRPSGAVLRLDAEGVESGATSSALLSRIPPPIASHIPAARLRPADRNWMDAFFGQWPGDETDAELIEALREVRG